MTETSAQLRAQAQEIRDHAAQLRAEGQSVLAAAEAEADRLRAEADRALAEARNKAAGMSAQAASTDHSADPVEKRAELLHAAEELVVTIPAAEARVVELVDEIETLGATVDGLDGHLEQRGVEREEVGVQLAAARDAGDVDGVLAARSRMSAIDEVVQALTGQRDRANERIRAIGAPDGDGELASVNKLVQDLYAVQRRVLNELDPERYEAQVDAVIGAVHDYVAEQTEQQKQQQQKRIIRIQN